jgi:uncharacterized protein YndB with AHSA1/START domain
MIQRVFRIVLVLVTAFIAAVLIGGFLTPSQWRSETSIEIQAPVSKVFEQLNTLKNWPTWTAWNSELYPELQIGFSGPESGEGARYQWFDGAMHGEVAIHQSIANESLRYSVTMDEGEFEMDCGFDLVDGASVGVSWACWGESGNNPVARLMMKFYEPIMRKDFEIGLQQLKAKLEP